jgi:hypothetical protein
MQFELNTTPTRQIEVTLTGSLDIFFYHNKRHPQEMGSRETEEYLKDLTVERNAVASTFE